MCGKLVCAYEFSIPLQKSLFRTTAGLSISYTVGRRHSHNFCCRGPILIPRPDPETLAQTTRGNVLDFFGKLKNGISASYTKRR